MRSTILVLGSVMLLIALAAVPAAANNTIFTCHTAGSASHLLKVCISREGNVLEIDYPTGQDQIYHEGYAVCYNFTGQANKVAYDAGFGSGGWGPATISQPGGVNTFPLTITRTTTDGALKLVQTFTWDTEKHGILIEMKLTNVSGNSLNFQNLARYFNGNFAGTPAGDIYDQTLLSVTGREQGYNRQALTLQALTDAAQAAINPFASWNAAACAQFGGAGPTAPGDWVGRVWIPGYLMTAGKTETVKFVYRAH